MRRSTARLACCTPMSRRPPLCTISSCASLAKFTLSCMSRCCMSSNIISLSGELGFMKLYFCWPSASNCMTEFSLFSTSRLVSAVLRLRVYDCTPMGWRLGERSMALVCMLTKRLAPALLAISARPESVTNTSVLRVYITLTSGQFCSSSLPTFSAIARFISFSRLVLGTPTAPASLPPCPASSTTMNLPSSAMRRMGAPNRHTIRHRVKNTGCICVGLYVD